MIKKIVLAIYRALLGMITLLIGVPVVLFTMVWDAINVTILKKPKKEHPSFDHLMEKELVQKEKESVSQPSSTTVDKR